MEINIKTLQLTAGELSVNTVQPITVIEMAGDVDANTAPVVQEQVLPLAKPGSKILLDMTKVPFLSSAGFRMLRLLSRQVSIQDGQIVLVGLADEILDTMGIIGFLDFFTTSETLDSGLEALK